MIRLIPCICAALLIATPAKAFESAACDTGLPSTTDAFAALEAATKLEAALNAQPHDVALIARRGGDITDLAPGLLFTHAALAWRKGKDAPWQVVHMLNDCGASGSTLYDEGLAAFFLQAPYSYEALMMPLPALAATGLHGWLASGKHLNGVHEPRYSLTAHPFSASLQNSNGFVLESVASFMDQAGDAPRLLSRQHAQAVLRQTGYAGTTISASLAQRVLGPLFKANLDLSDQAQPAQPQVVTVKSITDWLQYMRVDDKPILKPVIIAGPLR